MADLAQFESEMQRLREALGGAVEFPPPCFTSMNAEFIAYESRSGLTVEIPVSRDMLNPVGAMQGGFITAAIDNTMGPLSYLALRSAASTLDIHTQFIRAVPAGERLRVTASVVSMGPVSLVMEAEVLNSHGKLVARATANALAIRKEPRP